MSDSPWRQILHRVTTSEREHRSRAEQLWQIQDVIPAVRERGIADGLAQARDIHAGVIAEQRAGTLGPDVLDAALHSIWLHGDWRALTERMGADEREAVADAVQRYSTWLNRQDPSLAGDVLDLRWWR